MTNIEYAALISKAVSNHKVKELSTLLNVSPLQIVEFAVSLLQDSLVEEEHPFELKDSSLIEFEDDGIPF